MGREGAQSRRGAEGGRLRLSRWVVRASGGISLALGAMDRVSGGWSLSDGEGPRQAFLYLGLQLTSGRKGTP